jgi:hypothetical protein
MGGIQSKFAYALCYSLVIAPYWLEPQLLENGSHRIAMLNSLLELYVSVATMVHC